MKVILTAVLCISQYLSWCQEGEFIALLKHQLAKNCNICMHSPESTPFVIGMMYYGVVPQVSYHLCHTYFNQDQLDSAYWFAIKVQTEFSGKKDTIRLLLATLVRARILIKKSLYPESLPFYQTAYESNILDKELRIYACSNIAAIHIMAGDLYKALQFLESCVQNDRIKTDYNKVQVYSNLAVCNLLMGKLDKAEAYFEKGIAISSRYRDTVELSRMYMNIGSQYYNRYQDRKAEKYFTHSLRLALATGNRPLKLSGYLNMAVVEENKGRFQSALFYRKAYEAQNDSLFDRDSVWNLAQVEKRIALQEKEYKVQIEQQKNKVQALELSGKESEVNQQRQRFYIAVSTSAAFLMFFLFAVYAFRYKARQNRIIAAQRTELDALNHTKDQLFSVVAHDLRSPLQTLKIILTKMRTALSESNVKVAARISGEVEAIIDNSYTLLNNLLYWVLTQTGQLRLGIDNLNMKRLIDQVLYDYEAVAAIRDVELHNNVSPDLYCSVDMNTVKIIFRNLIDNAIKFSSPLASVDISGYENDFAGIITVVNQGSVIDSQVIQSLFNPNTLRIQQKSLTSQSTGIGLWLVKTMTEKNGGELHIFQEEKGTRIEICLPKSKRDV